MHCHPTIVLDQTKGIPISHVKATKKIAIVIAAAAAIFGLSACTGSTSNSSHIGIAKGGENQDKYLGPLTLDMLKSKTVGGWRTTGEHLACFLDKNKSWGIETNSQAVDIYQKQHPDIDTTSYDGAMKAYMQMTPEQTQVFNAWVDEAGKAAFSKGDDAVREQGLNCLLYEYHTSHAPLPF